MASIFAGTITPVFRGMMSRTVGADEQGKFNFFTKYTVSTDYMYNGPFSQCHAVNINKTFIILN